MGGGDGKLGTVSLNVTQNRSLSEKINYTVATKDVGAPRMEKSQYEGWIVGRNSKHKV